jgi:thiol-disulfide isomerase/thioredoxin
MKDNPRVITARAARRSAAALAAIALSALAGCSSKAPGPAPSSIAASCPAPRGITSVGEAMPANCSFEDFQGKRLRLDDLLGKPTVINFWATWCTFCIDEMPALQTVYSSLGGRVWFLGADLLDVQGETRGAATSFATRTGVRYPLVFDTGGILFGHFAARPILPVTIFVKPNGRVAFRQFGPMTEQKLRDLLREKLGVV